MLALNLTAMLPDEKRIKTEAGAGREETVLTQQLVHPAAEIRLILSNDDAARITAIGDVICQDFAMPLRFVRALSLQGNKLRALPGGFRALTALKKLSLADNELTKLFPGGCLLSVLEELDISHIHFGGTSTEEMSEEMQEETLIIWSGLFPACLRLQNLSFCGNF